MALLELHAINNRLIELEGHVAKHAVQASKALRDLQALIEEVQIETKRLGDAALMLEGATQALTCLGTAHDERLDGLRAKLEQAEQANDVGFLRMRELIREADDSAKQMVQHLEVQLGGEIEGLRSELLG